MLFNLTGCPWGQDLDVGFQAENYYEENKKEQILKWSGQCFDMNILTVCLKNETSFWLLHQFNMTQVKSCKYCNDMLRVLYSWKQWKSYSLYSVVETTGNAFLWLTCLAKNIPRERLSCTMGPVGSSPGFHLNKNIRPWTGLGMK